MPSLSDSNVKVTVSTSADTKGVKDTQDALHSLGNESEQSSHKGGLLNSSFATFGKTVAIVGGALATFQIAQQITAFGKASLQSAADLQQTSKSYEVLTGNVEVANKLFAQLAQYANTTPFEFPQISKAGQTLLGFGIASDKVYGRVQQLGDIAAATGADFQSLALVYGQVNAAGRLYGQDALQLINNSVPIYNILAKQMGISVKDVRDKMEDGAISADIFNKALQSTTEQGGFAFKGVDTLAKSFNGRMSTLRDTTTDFGRRLLGVNIDPQLGLVVQPGGVFDRLSNAIVGIIDSLQKFAPAASQAFPAFISMVKNAADTVTRLFGPSLEALWNTLANKVIPTLTNFWHNVVEPLLPVIGGLLVAAIWLVINGLNILLEVATPVINFLANNTWVIYGLATAFGILKGAMAMQATFAALNAGFAVITGTTIPAVMAQITALRALTMSGMVMGGIAVAGAIADIYLVMKAVESVRQAINDMNAAAASAKSAQAAAADTHAQLVNLSKNGTAEQKARANKLMGQGYADGGYTGRGASNEPAGIVHKGEYVVPKSQVDQNSGMPKMGNSVTNHIYVTLSSGGAVKEMFNQLNDDGIIVGMGLTPKQGSY